MLTKNLPEGLTLHLSESYMQLAPFETREVRLSGIAGAKGSYSVSFSASSELQPEVQVNLTLELSIRSETTSHSRCGSATSPAGGCRCCLAWRGAAS